MNKQVAYSVWPPTINRRKKKRGKKKEKREGKWKRSEEWAGVFAYRNSGSALWSGGKKKGSQGVRQPQMNKTSTRQNRVTRSTVQNKSHERRQCTEWINREYRVLKGENWRRGRGRIWSGSLSFSAFPLEKRWRRLNCADWSRFAGN